MKRGALLVFEGIDGSGKSTQLARLAARLRAAGHDVHETREPSDGPHGRRIRAAAAAGEALTAEEELALFVADRREHVAGEVAPTLARGAIVLCDRYVLSTAAYQGARGLDPERLLREGEAAFPWPDLALVFDLAPEAGLARVRARGRPLDPRFEEPEFLARVAANFRAFARPYVVHVPADGAPETVAARVDAVVRERLGLG